MTGRKGNIQAARFYHEMGLTHPTDLPIEDIAISQGAYVKMDELEGCEGRIVFDGDEAIITVDDKISYEPKKRFVIAHEIAHFRMHKNLNPAFIDNERTLNEWYAKGSHELEANSFAAEFLMPETLFSPIVKGEKFNMDLIYEVAEEFQCSVTATLLRYRDLGDYPIALILVKKGIVEWSQFTNDFPLQYIQKGAKVSPLTIAGDHFTNKNELETEPDLTKAVEWFPEDFDIERYKDWDFYEQCVHVSKDSVLACLWTF